MKYFLKLAAVTLGIVCLLATPEVINAGFIPTRDFGGKTLVAPIPGLICIGTGASLLLSSNVAAFTQTVTAAVSSGDKNKAANIISGILSMIPTYATNPTRIPRTGQDILGQENLIPNFSTCYITFGIITIPIPVYKTTNNYGVARPQ